jgi:hypothetical protein
VSWDWVPVARIEFLQRSSINQWPIQDYVRKLGNVNQGLSAQKHPLKRGDIKVTFEVGATTANIPICTIIQLSMDQLAGVLDGFRDRF